MMASAAAQNGSFPLLLPLLFCILISGSKASSSFAASSAHQNASEADRQALLCLRSHLSDASGALNSWRNESLSFCNWRGVSCSTQRQRAARVVALDLASLNLTGSISPCIAELGFLSAIDMMSNQISGPIPQEIGRLTELRSLNLSVNSLTGVIPDTISSCSKLEVITIANNSIEGEIPASIADLQFLQEITLSNNNLSGTIPSGIGLLPNLQYLLLASNNLEGSIPETLGGTSPFLSMVVLRNNRLTGQIPPSLANSSSLSFLNLMRNKLNGSVPAALFKSPSLKTLVLSYNEFSGSIPSSYLIPSQLSYVSLTSNFLSGAIPDTIGNFSSLSILLLAQNNLEENIPESITKLPNLQVLDLAYNNLTGPVPQKLYNITNLTYLGLGVNKLVGRIPSDIGYTLPNVETIVLESNEFEGPLPVSLLNASKLQALQFRDNAFTGVVPSFWSLPYLNELDLGANRFEAVDWSSLSIATSSATQLQIVYLDNNKIQGVLPNSIGFLSRSLTQIFLTNNNFTGTIPSEIGNLTNLKVLQLQGNNLFGSIPDTIGKLTNLFALSLADNRLSGELPQWFGNFKQLSELYLQENNFSGPIPPSLAGCKNLVMLNLSYNSFQGTIPDELFTISSLSKGLDLSYNKLTGPVASSIGDLINLGILNISNNQLSGEIPRNLGQCLLLESIRLEGNFFRGSIPSTFVNLRGIIEMDLSQNNLSGEIPNFLESFSTLQYLNLSFNNLQGVVPSGGTFSNSSKVFLQGNKMLCVNYPMLALPLCKPAPSKKMKTSSIIILVVVLTSAAIFVTCLAIILLKRRNRPKGEIHQSFRELKNFSYSDLARATKEFSSTNIVGSGRFGTVYRGTLKFESHPVAIKVFKLDQIGGHKNFLAECEVLRNTRHRNLIKVISLCSSSDVLGNEFRALILEYMGNGSLESWIHSNVQNDKKRGQLDLGSRITIALDIASAIDYLHNWCTPPLVHCDLKPSNVLLDDDMVAHVSDFGLAKFLYNNSSSVLHSSTSIVGPRGSVGYIAPEYGMGCEISTAGDVYSFGVILLELLTGKHPTEDTFANGLTLHSFVESATISQDFSKILDSSLPPYCVAEEANHGTEQQNQSKIEAQSCLNQLARLGLKCSVDSPRDRPSIRDVYSEIITIKEAFSGLLS